MKTLSRLFHANRGCRIAILAVVALGPTTDAQARTLHVGPRGDDANPGTSEAPWRTIQHAADNRNITARNNIFAFSRRAQIERYGVGGFELTCQRNLVYYREGTALGASGVENGGTNVCLFDQNLYWNASGQPVRLGNKTLAEWRAGGQDMNGIVADPLFVDPARGDFRLQPDSPAEAIRFEPWDLTAVGPR